MSDDPNDDSIAHFNLLRAFSDPELKPWNLDHNDLLADQELMIVGYVRAARRAVSIGWVGRACDCDERTVQLALEKLANMGWVKQVEGHYIAL